MVAQLNMLNDPSLAKMADQAGSHVTNAIHQASQKTGADFAYLMEKASAESSFRPDIQAKTSSATGLYQFIESTWLRMVNNYGDKHGLGKYADMIDQNDQVSDPQAKQKILDLRKDPENAALMAAEFASENKRVLESRVGGDVGATELYLAHFLGAGGASEFLNARQSNPDMKAASILPAAANANEAVFYRQDGSQKTLDEVYSYFDQKFQSGKPESLNAEIADQEDPSAPTRSPAFNAYQKAFIPYQSSYDRAVTELLLSPDPNDNSFTNSLRSQLFSNDFLSLLDM
mgnify:CR=1 FL=1